MIPRVLDKALSNAPSAVGAYYNAYKTARWGDPYVKLVASLADRDRLAIDVGAHHGDYTFFMRRHARRCIAFECNPSLVAWLTRLFGSSVDVHAQAASDHAGSAVLRVPLDVARGLGRATIEEHNPLEREFPQCHTVTVPTVRLDDVIDQPVGLMKIDVEGHEMSVLRGAERILDTSQPNLILELEERHNPGIMASTFGFLDGFGYRAAILVAGRLMPFRLGDPINGQNNFVFTPGPSSRLLAS